MNVLNHPKKVLHVVSAMNRGGVETLIMNIYRNVDKNKIQFDFITHREEVCHYDKEIESLGGTIFRIPSLGKVGPIRYLREITNILKENDYVALHAHTDYQCGFPVLAANLTGIKKRISHSHSNNWGFGNSYKAKIKLSMLRALIRYNSNEFCACSVESGQFLFGNQKRNIRIFKNGIDIKNFQIIPDCYQSVRAELNIPNSSKILGHVGTFSKSKNQQFILNILKEIINSRTDIYVVFVGEGPLKKEIETEAKRYKLENHVRFLGVRNDIARLMQAFDVLLFPSIFEGFGIVTIEAQSLGTPCIASNNVTTKTDMGLGIIKYLALNRNVEEWIQEISNTFEFERQDQEEIMRHIVGNGYNIIDIIPEWLSLYGEI